MSEVCLKENQLNQKDELYRQYNWFVMNFLPKIQKSCDEFFTDLFSINLLAISKNINILFQGNNYFVTKIRVDRKNDVLLRCSEDAVKIILDGSLGQRKKSFSLETLTELEAKIITSFNDYVYESLTPFIKSSPAALENTKEINLIHMTFFIKAKGDKDADGGKIILTIPKVLMDPENVVTTSEKFSETDFLTSKVDAKLKIGTTKFLVKDLKNLDKEDLVIFENSDINYMTLNFKDFVKRFQVRPNPGLVISINDKNDGGDNMADNSLSQDLWDNIEVEMGAEFDKVKITLGELKNIEQGLIVDLSSVYNNKVSLKVEDKIIAKGELVIINDRYGVRIEEVYASDKTNAETQVSNNDAQVEANPEAQETDTTPKEVQPGNEEKPEDFDYSDFELDDEDI